MPTRVGVALLTIGLLFAGLSDRAAAQDEDRTIRPQGSVSLMLGVPQGEFRDNVSRLGFGLDAFAGLGFEPSPFVVGIDFGFLTYGRETSSRPFSPTIPDVTVDVETTNNIVQTHFVLRMQLPEGGVRPYLDGLVGFKYLFTQTSIESERRTDQEPIARSTNFSDFAWSYGLGGGVDVPIHRPSPDDEEEDTQTSIRSVDLRLGAQYLFGSEAEYAEDASVEIVDGEALFDVARSRTTFLEPVLGITVKW